MTTKDDPDVPVTTLVGIVGALLTFVLIVALQALFYRAEQREFDRKAREPGALRSARAEQQANIHGYRWIDRDAGVVAIPIERAMKLVVEEHRTSAGPGP